MRLLYFIMMSFSFGIFFACSNQEFAAENARTGKEPSGKCRNQPAGKCSDRPITGDPDNPDNPQDPKDEFKQPDLTKDPVKPALRTDDGGLAVNVQLTKIEVEVTVDHVTDFKIINNEIYAEHRHLGAPVFASVKLFGPDGKEIQTDGWNMTFPSGCRYLKNPVPAGQCVSNKITLKAGTTIKGNFTKVSGRRRAWLFEAPGVVRIADCGKSDCGAFDATGEPAAGADSYHWILQ